MQQQHPRACMAGMRTAGQASGARIKGGDACEEMEAMHKTGHFWLFRTLSAHLELAAD